MVPAIRNTNGHDGCSAFHRLDRQLLLAAPVAVAVGAARDVAKVPAAGGVSEMTAMGGDLVAVGKGTVVELNGSVTGKTGFVDIFVQVGRVVLPISSVMEGIAVPTSLFLI